MPFVANLVALRQNSKKNWNHFLYKPGMAKFSLSKLHLGRKVNRLVNITKGIILPFTGGLPLYWVGTFFFRNLKKEPISLRASSIAFNLFLSLFPALIFMFTLLPIIQIGRASC